MLVSFPQGSIHLLSLQLFMTNRWAFLQTALTCRCSSWPVKYRGDSVWFETPSLLYSKLCCYNRAFFETVICKMFATEDRVIGCIPPIGTNPLHLLIPSYTQGRISRKAKQAYTIGMGVRTTSSNTALDHIVDLNANVYISADQFL